MIDEQDKYFQKEVVPSFEKENAARMDVVHYEHLDSIGNMLGKYPEAALVKIPFSEGSRLAESELLLPLNRFLTEEELREYRNTYLLTSLAERRGECYFVPRKFETRIMVYRKSKVAWAYARWREHRTAIHEALQPLNGYGLPATYILEQDPGEWDYFDVFAVGWLWANADGGADGAGRVAHRGKRYTATAQRIIDRVYQCGGDSAAVVSLQGEAVSDAFYWEAMYAYAGIYNPRMWEKKWSGSDIWQGFADEEVYLSFMTQLDCFYLHGTGRDGLNGYLSDPEDMGVAIMPRGCSVTLDEQGSVVRRGTHAITTGGWWWGIPAQTPDPRKSYALARHITNTDNQIQECSRFGMIPVRKDILSDMSLLFGGTWISQIYSVSFKQLMHNNRNTVPAHTGIDQIIDTYLDAWFQIVVEQDWSSDGKVPDRNYVKSILQQYADGLSAGE
ncbi:MAG: extracellular solute-binding protein [Chitinivibrionales bacterium]